MGQFKNTTRNRKNKDLNERERWLIERYRDDKLSGREIARRLGRSHTTINRELKRGTLMQFDWELREVHVYRADYAQRGCLERQKNKGRSLKIGYDHELSRHIEKKILEDRYSPAAVIGEIHCKKLKFKTKLCIKTVYNYVYSGVFAGIDETELLYRKNRTKKYKKVGKISKSRLFKSIEVRPEKVNDRNEYGHWEIDLVKGKAETKPCLLTLSERLTRQEIIIRLNRGKMEEVDKAFTRLEEEYGRYFPKIFKTMTADNGVEFLDWERLEESKMKPGTKRTQIYYAHPYSSFERGTNENLNRMIRRFIPKGTDIGKVTGDVVKKAQNWINNYPRGIFGYKTANDMIRRNVTRKTGRMLGVVQ